MSRYKKEIDSYVKEQVIQKERIAKLNGGCPHDLAKQEEVLQETEVVIQQCHERLLLASNDLLDFIVQ